MNWLTPTIGDVCLPTLQGDPARTGRKSFRYVDIAGVDRDSKSISKADEVPSDDAPSRARKMIEASDVLVSTVRPNLNAIALVPENLDGEVASTGFAVLRANRELLDPKYLFYWAQSTEFVNFLVKNATGASYPAVTDGVVKRAPIPLPTLKEQSRIVEVLEEADRLRRLRREADAKAARILPALFLKTFGDPATNPMRWAQATLGEFGVKARYGLGQPPKQCTSGLPLLRATNIDGGRIIEKNLIFVEKQDVPPGKNAFLSSEEVLVVRSGAYTGDVAQVTDKWAGAVAGYDLVITPAAGWSGEFIEQFLLTPFVQRTYFESQKGRAGQPHLNSTQLEATPAFNPPESLQNEFAKQVRAVRSLRDQCIENAERLEQVFTVLLQHAFAGQLTAKWREGHMQELMAEMAQQARALNLPVPKELEVLS